MDNYPCSRLPTANLGAVASAVGVVTQEEHLHMGLRGWGIYTTSERDFSPSIFLSDKITQLFFVETILSPVLVLVAWHVSSTLSLEWVNGPSQPDLSI